MSVIPAFKIGVWNAWIMMLYFPLHPFLMMALDRLFGVGGINKKMKEAPFTGKEKNIFRAMMILFALALIYSVFLPLKLGTPWFYVGLPVYAFGLIMLIVAMINIATTPHGQPFTRGLYRFSRHPMMIWGNVIHLGVSVATASWVFLLFSIMDGILYYYVVIAEERGCLEYYQDAYRDYMNRTPRWIGLPKSQI